MPTVSDIVEYLERIAPLALAEEWDNTGLLIGRRDANVDKVMTCLTLTDDVAAEAIASQAQLVVSHHPVLFRGTKKLVDDTAEGRMLLDLVAAGVSVAARDRRVRFAAHAQIAPERESITEDRGTRCVSTRTFVGHTRETFSRNEDDLTYHRHGASHIGLKQKWVQERLPKRGAFRGPVRPQRQEASFWHVQDG